MVEPFITAIRTLTILPVPGRDAKKPSDSLPYFALVGIIVGLLLYGVAYGSLSLFKDHHGLSALIIVFTATCITGGLHIDGLADVADAFGRGGTRERILETLKDPRHGTFGVVTIVFDLLLKVHLVSWYCENNHIILIAIMPVVTRHFQALGCSFFPYARKEGGTAAAFISKEYRILLVAVMLLVTALSVYLIKNYSVVVIIAGTFIPVLLLYLFCTKKIGGITGDCIGAANELGEVLFLLFGYIFFSYSS